MGPLQRFGMVVSAALACAASDVYAQSQPTLVGIMSGGRSQGVLVRCARPDASLSTRLLFEGETACDRFTLVGVDGLTARIRDVASGADLTFDLPAGTAPTAPSLHNPTSLPLPSMPVVDVRATPGEVHVRLGRDQLAAYLRNLPALLAGAVVQPLSTTTSDGPHVDGFELRAVADGGLVAALGLRSGDILLELNGARLASTSLVLAAVEGLTTAGHATALVRRGESRVMFVVDVE